MVKFKSNTCINLTVIAGLAMVTWQILIGPLDYQLQLLLFTGSMFIIGIPHGAFDFLVEKEVFRRNDKSFHGSIFRLKYLTTMVFYAVFWVFFPQISMIAFLLMSSWHFGETDLKKIKTWPKISTLVRLVYGSSVLIWIIFAHSTESYAILLHLLPTSSVTLKLWIAAFTHVQIILLISGTLLITSLGLNQLNKRDSQQFWSVIQLLTVLSCCYFLPLLPAFALYFVGWHSVTTLKNIKQFINGDIALDKPLTTLKMIIIALPASIMSIGALLVIGYLFKHYAPIFDPLPLLFVFLSLITLPHMQVMNKLSKFSLKNKKDFVL